MPPLTDKEVNTLGTQGFKEGSNVPGRGVLRPDGTFSGAPTPAYTGPFSSANLTREQQLGEANALLEKTKKGIVNLVPTNKGFTGRMDYSTNQNGTFIAVDPITGRDISQMPGAGFVSSSAPVVEDNKNTINTVAGLSVPNPSVEARKKTSEDYTKLIEEQYSALEQQRKSEIEGINKSFDIAKTQTEGAQKGELGTTNVALQRVGGYLGTQMSGVGVLNNLAQTHRQELSALEAKRASAIQMANSAINDKQFALAKAKAQEVKDLDQEINRRNTDFFNQTIKLSEENRQKQKAAFDMAIDTTERIAPSLIESIAGMDEASARNYIFSAASDLKIDPNLLMGEVNSLIGDRREKEVVNVVSLATKYPSAGILRSDSFDVAQQKIRASREYRLDIAKAEADLSNTRSLINQRVSDSKVDYSDPILKLYADSTGEVVSSPSKARAVLGYTDSLLTDKEVVSDTFSGPLEDNQVRESDARKLISDAFRQFNTKKEEELPDATVWSWLASDEAQGLSDDDKKTQIMQNGKNPEDFGIY